MIMHGSIWYVRDEMRICMSTVRFRHLTCCLKTTLILKTIQRNSLIFKTGQITHLLNISKCFLDVSSYMAMVLHAGVHLIKHVTTVGPIFWSSSSSFSSLSPSVASAHYCHCSSRALSAQASHVWQVIGGWGRYHYCLEIHPLDVLFCSLRLRCTAISSSDAWEENGGGASSMRGRERS